MLIKGRGRKKGEELRKKGLRGRSSIRSTDMSEKSRISSQKGEQSWLGEGKNNVIQLKAGAGQGGEIMEKGGKLPI